MYIFQVHYILFWFFFFYFVQVVALTLLCGTLPINWINVIFFHWNVLYYINLWFRSLNFVQSIVHYLELPEWSINSNKLANCAKWNSMQCVGFESWIKVKFNFDISAQITTSLNISTVVVPSMLLRASSRIVTWNQSVECNHELNKLDDHLLFVLCSEIFSFPFPQNFDAPFVICNCTLYKVHIVKFRNELMGQHFQVNFHQSQTLGRNMGQ